MRPVRLGLCISLLGVGCSGTASQQPEPQATPRAIVFEGARLIVGDGSTINDASFVVENNRFTQVGARGTVQAPAGAARVDLAGKTVMPAIINGHTHLGYVDLNKDTEESLEHYTRQNLVETMQRFAYYGVGAALSMGNDGGQGELPWMLQSEEIPNGARFLTTGPGISTPGGGQGGVRKDSWTVVRTPDEARAAVKTLAPRQPVLVKIWVDDRNKSVESMPSSIYAPLIDEAHKHGLRVGAHLVYLKDAKELARAGLDGFVHVVRDVNGPQVDDEFIQILRERPGVFLMALLADPPDRQGGYTADELPWMGETLPAAVLQDMREELASRKPNPAAAKSWAVLSGNFAKLHRAGVVRIGMGTDGPIPWAAHQEMADMVAAGMTPADVIVASTKTNAEILRLEDLGTVAIGKSADFLVLDANPLDDITNTRRINKVYLRGKEVDRAGLRTKFTRGPSS